MMFVKKFIWFLNMVYYVLYKLDFKLHLFFNRANPFNLIHKIPFQKKKYEIEGVNINESLNESFKRPDIGISSMRAGGLIGMIFFFFLLGILNLYFEFITSSISLQLYHLVILGGVSLLIYYFVILKNDKYLNYFKEFERMSKKEKRKWAWISLIMSLLIITFWIFSEFYI